MTATETTQSPRNFLGFRFKTKGSTPKQSYLQPEIASNHANEVSEIPRQPHNPAIHPLLAKPEAREENFVLFPIRSASSKRKRDPMSPVRSAQKPKARDDEMTEWTRYVSSYHEGRFNMSNPPEPPEKRPSGYLKAPIPSNDAQRALREYFDVVRPSDPVSAQASPTTRSQIDRFQRLIVAARQAFQTKIALLSLVDEKRQFFKCEAGLGNPNIETDREITFCGHTILSNEPMVVLNAGKDWRLADNPLVKGYPYIRFYAGAPIITPSGYAIGTVCVIDTEPRESFDVSQRRKLTEFARLAMDEIELAQRARKATSLSSAETDPSKAVPAELRGMTAVASEAGTIDASIAGKDIKRAVQGIDDMELVESAMTVTDKRSTEQLKFKYGRNTTIEVEALAQGVESAARKGDPRRVQKPVENEQHGYGKAPEVSTVASSDSRREDSPESHQASDPQVPLVRPKSGLRARPYASRNTSLAADGEVKNIDSHEKPKKDATATVSKGSSSVIQQNKRMSGITRIPNQPIDRDFQTKSSAELAAQLIARALIVDFVYFMRITPVTPKSPNRTVYRNAEVNLDLLGSYGLPFPTISFSPFTHMEALRTESGMIYRYDLNESDSSQKGTPGKDYYRIGMVMPVWREYPKLNMTSSGVGKLTRSGSVGSSIASTTTIASLRLSCKNGVVVGVFSKRADRTGFSRIEREYLKEWVSLRDHL